MTSILQWGHTVLGCGAGESLQVQLLLLQRLPTQRESCSLVLTRLATEANSLALVVAREELAFTNSSSTPLLLVEYAVRASKYSSRSAVDLVGMFACWTWGACPSTPCVAQDCSLPETACFLILAFWSATLYSFF